MPGKRKTRSSTKAAKSSGNKGGSKRGRQTNTSNKSKRRVIDSESDENTNNSDEDEMMWGGGSGRRNRGTSRSSPSTATSSRSTSSGMSESSIDKMFADLADEDDPSIASMEGISKFCEKVDIDPLEDIRILVLLWKMGATKKPAQISSEEWKSGCKKLQVDSISKFKALLPSLDTGFLERSDFEDFYKFCFQFNRQGTHKTLDKDIVIGLLGMVLKGRVNEERLATFIEFLSQTTDESYSKITLDQWTSFLSFCYEVEDIADYDEDMSAWPVLIDEYVEYMTNKK